MIEGSDRGLQRQLWLRPGNRPGTIAAEDFEITEERWFALHIHQLSSQNTVTGDIRDHRDREQIFRTRDRFLKNSFNLHDIPG